MEFADGTLRMSGPGPPGWEGPGFPVVVVDDAGGGGGGALRERVR